MPLLYIKTLKIIKSEQLLTSLITFIAHAAMVEALAAKALHWENERGVAFMFDGVSTYNQFDFLTL